MKELRLEKASEEYREEVEAYKQEFIDSKDSMDGTGGLAESNSFDDWHKKILDYSREETVPEGKVASYTYFLLDENDTIIGMSSFRHRLNEYLLNFGGHIGYSIRKSERRKGYAKELLRLTLIEAKKLGIDRVLVTCNKSNLGSAKTILANGGVLENEIDKGEKVTQRYWIENK